MEQVLIKSQQTQIIASILKRLEDTKKTNQQLLKYSQAFLKLSDNELSAQHYINTICKQKNLEESLEIADTLKVLSRICKEASVKPQQKNDLATIAELNQSKKMVKLAFDVSVKPV